MPNILYPDVPAYPGVPQLVRLPAAAVASNAVVATSLGILSNVLAQAAQQEQRWGIFDQQGNQLGLRADSESFIDVLESQITGATRPQSTTLRYDRTKEVAVSDYPVEGGSFAMYNKVERPANPVIVLCCEGSESDRAYFLNAIEAACISTDKYNVVTPEVTYVNYTLERSTITRSAEQGANLIAVEISLLEVREVSATFATASVVKAPQNAAATSQSDGGKVQAPAPDTSTLKSLTNKLGSIIGQISGSN